MTAVIEKQREQQRHELGASLSHELRHFTGTQGYKYNPLYPWLKYTDGVKHFLQRAGAYWFLDILGTELQPVFGTRFRFWSRVVLTVNQAGATIAVYLDTERRVGPAEELILSKHLPLTDCPYGEWKFVLNHRVLCLPSEN